MVVPSSKSRCTKGLWTPETAVEVSFLPINNEQKVDMHIHIYHSRVNGRHHTYLCSRLPLTVFLRPKDMTLVPEK